MNRKKCMNYWEEVKYFLKKIGILRIIPDELYLKFLYRKIMGKKLDLKNPKTFNEKLQWLKIHDRNPLYTKLVDKYEVREYIKEKIGEEYLIPLVGGPWNNADEIDFDALPDRFVLKCTHDSGSVIVCRDKSKLDIDETRKKLNRCLDIKFYYLAREWPYKDVKPRIIAERYMEDEPEDELRDYQLMCFNAKVKTTFVCSDRYSGDGLKVTFFDTDWQRMPFERHYSSSKVEIESPRTYDEMVKIAEELSRNIPFVRVDFYEIKGKAYFGEFTFYPGGDFEEFSPREWDIKLGNWIELPDIRGGVLAGEGYVLWIHADSEICLRDCKHIDNASIPVDYKVFCFEGEPKLIMTVAGGHENEEIVVRRIYDTGWNKQTVGVHGKGNYAEAEQPPDQLDQLLDAAKKLSKGIKHVRLDFYIINNGIKFGEFTFYHMGGFERFDPESWDLKLGEWINIG